MEEVKLFDMKTCNICPHSCNADRISNKKGVCRTSDKLSVSAICLHYGEEPVLSGFQGIVNIFFSNCNLRCIYCQNHQISFDSNDIIQNYHNIEDVIKKICNYLDCGCNTVGFVSPTHNIPNMLSIIKGLWDAGREPIIVYNSNGYDKVETLKYIEDYIDVYLPDFKYVDDSLALKLSKAPGYSEIALSAIKEMYRQKGANLYLDDNGYAISGLIIRHLILPGYIENSINVLDCIANKLTTSLHISLMSQYMPTIHTSSHSNLRRKLNFKEYEKVLEHFEGLGFYNGWVQSLDSSEIYFPDFSLEIPF
ncbi:MAG: Radical protein [Ignavibacteria bacterium]|nr:Radical protein [Ignavibacteria bacterium]